MANLRILLADDHAVVREGLKTLISKHPEMEVIGEAADGLAVIKLANQLTPDVVVVDISMPGLNGAQVTTRLKQSQPELKVLALTVHEDKGYLRMLLEAGASGYVLKRAAASELIHAIQAVAAGGTYLDPALAGGIVGAFVHPAEHKKYDKETAELSDRETAVVKLIAQGYSNKEVAAKLEISIKTVETYKLRSLEKLNLRSRVDIVRYASKRGWLSLE